MDLGNVPPDIIIRFLLGAFGALTYFISAKAEIFNLSKDDPVRNPRIFKPHVIIFFLVLGGALPLLSDTRAYVACFAMGLSFRPIIISLFNQYGGGNIGEAIGLPAPEKRLRIENPDGIGIIIAPSRESDTVPTTGVSFVYENLED